MDIYVSIIYMKPRLNTFSHQGNESFQLKISEYYHALSEFHYHQEIELLYVIEGEGLLLIGEQFEQVSKGMLLLIGSNTPHMFKFEQYIYANALMKQGRQDLKIKLLTLHLDVRIFGDEFFNLPENQPINNLLKEALKGINFIGGSAKTISDALLNLQYAAGPERIFLLLQLLAILAAIKERQFITAEPHLGAYNENDETRLTKVYLYTLNNFHKTISLKEIASMVYMVPNAFCRYFKLRTNKTYFTFLMEVRIRHACKLLKEQEYSVVVVCYESGFSNLSNFNRHFKQIVGKTPLEYRNFFNMANK